MRGDTDHAVSIRAGRRGLISVALLAIAALQIGCGGKAAGPGPGTSPMRAPEPAVDVPLAAELAAAANRVRAVAIRLRGQLRIGFATNDREQSHAVELLAVRSGAMRLRASSDGRGFEIVSDGVEVFVRRDGDNAVEWFSAQQLPVAGADVAWASVPVYALVDAVLPTVMPAEGGADDLLVTEQHPGAAWLTWLQRDGERWRPRRRVAIDNESELMTWFETFDQRGVRTARVEYGAWTVGESKYPRQILLDHVSGVRLSMTVESVDLQPVIESHAFRLDG